MLDSGYFRRRRPGSVATPPCPAWVWAALDPVSKLLAVVVGDRSLITA